jgi:hypothetical protein
VCGSATGGVCAPLLRYIRRNGDGDSSVFYIVF